MNGDDIVVAPVVVIVIVNLDEDKLLSWTRQDYIDVAFNRMHNHNLIGLLLPVDKLLL